MGIYIVCLIVHTDLPYSIRGEFGLVILSENEMKTPDIFCLGLKIPQISLNWVIQPYWAAFK